MFPVYNRGCFLWSRLRATDAGLVGMPGWAKLPCKTEENVELLGPEAQASEELGGG